MRIASLVPGGTIPTNGMGYHHQNIPESSCHPKSFAVPSA
jgi:hypothetical protein